MAELRPPGGVETGRLLGQARRLIAASRANSGLAQLGRGLAAALVSRSVSALTILLAVPLTISYLGSERYGVWVVINTMIFWLTLADLGLGNGLVNAVAAANGQGRPDLARQQISNAFFLLGLITLSLMGLTLLVVTRLDWATIFNVQSEVARSEVGPALTLAMLLVLLAFPFSLVRKILEALQEGDRAYILVTVGSLSSLAGLVLVTQLRGGLLWLVIGVLGAQSVAVVAGGVWLFWYHRPDLRPALSAVDWPSLGSLMQLGTKFFLVQILALINLSTDALIITRFLGPEAVAPYNVTWQLLAYATLFQQLAYPLVWSQLAQAAARGDKTSVVRTYRLFMGLSVASALALVVPLLFLAQPLIALWAGASVVPPQSLVLWMGAWNILLAVMNGNSCLLNSHSRLRGQLTYGTVTAIMNIGLSVWLAPSYGSTGVIAATVIAYLVFALVPSQVEVLMTLRRTYGK